MDPQLIGILASLAGGAIGKKTGQLTSGGGKLGKLLGPLAAIAVGVGASLATGGQLPVEDVLAQGGTNGAVAIGIFSAAKNIWQFIGPIVKKPRVN